MDRVIIQNPEHKIAVFTLQDTSVSRQVQNGFLSTLAHHFVIYEYAICHAYNSAEMVKKLMVDVVSKDFTLLVTIGKTSTRVAKDITMRQNKRMPILFCAIEDPVGQGLIYSEQSSRNHLTGTTCCEPDYRLQMQHLLYVKPDLKKVAFLYDPNGGTIKDVNEAYQQFISIAFPKGISVIKMTISDKIELLEKLTSLLSNVDAIIISRDNIFYAEIQMLTTLCDTHRVILYASDLESVRRGATLGWADFDYATGIKTAEFALSLFKEKQSPSHLPVHFIKQDYKLMVNSRALIGKRVPYYETIQRVLSLESGRVV